MNPGWADLDRGLFSISVAAELAGLHPQTLRIYEREGLLDPVRSAGGTRRYSRRDIDRLLEICALTADGLNLAGIRRVLEMQKETRQLQAEVARLRAMAGGRAARPPGEPGHHGPPAVRPRARARAPPGLALVRPALAGEPCAQPGRQLALSGEGVFQRQDPERSGQRVALVEHPSDPGGEGELPAGIPAAPASCPLRGNRTRGVQGTQERLTDAQDLGRPAGGVGRVVRIIKIIEPGHGRGCPLILGSGHFLKRVLTVSCSPDYIKSVSVMTW